MIPKSILNNRFISPTIYKYIIDNDDKFIETVINVDANSIYLLSMIDIEPNEVEDARKIYTEVASLANVSNDKINIYIYLNDFEKHLDLDKDNITSTECNTASTTFFIAEEYVEVVLWRREEWRKVLYHELIHAFNIDYRLRINPAAEIKILELLPHYNKSIREAYTEVLATLLTNPKSLKDETIFLGSQVNKIIYFMTVPRKDIVEIDKGYKNDVNNKDGVEYIRRFFTSPNRLLDGSTNTSSYYILKSIYLWYGIYKESELLNVSNITNKSFINTNFYRVLLDGLENGEYIKWLEYIYFKPTNTSLRLTYNSF
jgi:hypothetical protein